MRVRNRRATCEQLEARQLLSGTYVVPEVSDLAFTQPLINYTLTLPGQTDPIGGFYGPAFLDTGTSGNILSTENATTLGIPNETYNGQTVVFQDIGVSGQSGFNVSQPLQLGLAAFTSILDDPTGTFTAGPTVQMEINPFPTADLLGDPVDIIGMPGMMGKVMVMDPKPFFDPNNIDDMRTYLYSPTASDASFDPNRTTSGGLPDPGIPPTSLQVKFNYANFAPYTFIDPSGAPGPTLADNPIIGPNPLNVFLTNPPVDNTPPVTMSLNGATATGSFLFDTGAQGSFMSQAEAAKFGVFYRAGTYGSDAPILVDANNNPIPNQSVLPFGGLDGTTTNVSEFYLDSLSLQTTSGVTIRFVNVPISVLDVNLDDANGNPIINPKTNQPFVLDGDFGVNYLLSSEGGGTAPAFNWMTFDTNNQTIGFDPNGTISSGTASVQGRKLFYDNSFFDGHVPGPSTLDDNAIAGDKAALLSTAASSSFDNISSYPAGINGIMVDIAGATGTPNFNDFSFIVGNSVNAASWQPLSVMPAVTVRPGAGGGGSTRIELTWPDGTIRNEWLQVTVAADSRTGLPAPDTFLFGSLVGASGQPAGSTDTVYSVTAADVTAAQNDPHGFTNPVNTFNVHDYNRDGRVDITDQMIARFSSGNSLVILGSPSIFGAPLPAAAAALASSSTANNSKKAAGNKVLTRAQIEAQFEQKSFKLRKQRAIAGLKALISHSAAIQNPKVRKQLVASYRAQLTAVRGVTISTPGALNSTPRMF